MKAEHTIAGSPSPWRLATMTLALPLALLSGRPVMAESDPTLDQVYQAARAGQLEQAQQMMQPVLRDHPNSAKAHYVEADLLAKQGQTGKAREELAVAQRLAPGLPFARADAVQGLRRALDAPTGFARSNAGAVTRLDRVPSPTGSIPWRVLLTIVGGGLLAWLLMRLARPQGGPVATAPAGFSVPPAGQNWAPQGMAAMAAAPSGGLGQPVAGGLATGLAVGAGVMAAEAIGHRLFADPGSSMGALAGAQRLPFDQQADAAPMNPDLGGRDFGIGDPGSWDDGNAPASDWDN